MSRVKVLPYARLQRESRCVVRAFGTEIVLFEVHGRIHAVENECPHQGMPLEDGLLDAANGTLTCLYHQWCFRLGDGGGQNQAARIRLYTATVDDGYVWLTEPA